ncbi:hypothetical protein AcV7_006109 [Taiwanofungus camphoratus]|nr:hypothetical protein AcV7_006109 [Antrodia cinnamomea]KAI0919348.1 hypothetical protein AcV7_006109 [Antrodia cinnamomea]
MSSLHSGHSESLKAAGAPVDHSDETERTASLTSATPPERIHFDREKAGRREVDPAELIGKTLKNMYEINGWDYPGSVGMAFTDGSKYHLRMLKTDEDHPRGGMEHDFDFDDCEGKRVTDCALLRCTAAEWASGLDGMGWRSEGSTHIAFGIKFEGADDWQIIHGNEEEYDSECALIMSTYHTVYLVNVQRETKRRDGRKAGGRRY